jgi:hypothetical protein
MDNKGSDHNWVTLQKLVRVAAVLRRGRIGCAEHSCAWLSGFHALDQQSCVLRVALP